MSRTSHSALSSHRRRSKLWRLAAALALALVLGLAFIGHLSADLRLQWENLMALCGF